MDKNNHRPELPEDKRHELGIINRLATGKIVILCGSVLALKQTGIVARNASTLHFPFIAFGILLVFGGIFRFLIREKNDQKKSQRPVQRQAVTSDPCELAR